MNAPEHNLCLLNMPELVLDKILSNVHNPSNVARTCKCLYEFVCGMEKCRRVMHIGAFDATLHLNIDANAVFDSIMNSHRTIKEIDLRLDRSAVSSYQLNERQLERIFAIVKQLGANITSLKFEGFVLPINFILEMLQLAPKVESLSFSWGKVMDSITEHRTMLFHLSSLKALEIIGFSRPLDIVNLIPAGSLYSVRYTDQSTDSTEALATILTKQDNIKSLTLKVRSNSDLTALCVDHLQLESLMIDSFGVDDNSHFEELLKCQMNLKELRFVGNYFELRGRDFQWICNNLKKLEVFEVQRMDSSIHGNAYEMLGELKKLRHFRTSDALYSFVNGFQSSHFRSATIQQFEIGVLPVFICGELLTKMVKSMAHNLPNLTQLQMSFKNFSDLCFLLGHCTQIIHLNCLIRNIIPHQLTDQRFPNIKSLELHNNNDNISDDTMGQCMISILRAMSNLKSMSLFIRNGLKFDVMTMMEFIKESKSLKYFHVDCFKLNPELSADDVVETIRCLMVHLNGYRIKLRPSTSVEGLNCRKIKEILSKDFYVRDDNWNRRCFYLYK